MNRTDTSSRRKNERRDSPQLSVQELIAQVVVVFRNAAIPTTNSKVSRLVRGYTYRPAANGYEFADYLLNSLALTVMQRQSVRDELARVLAHADPVGELAVSNVMNSTPRKG